MTSLELKSFLDEKVLQYNTKAFIKDDPIQIPHHFQSKEDIEISGFLAATIAWGQRKTIIRNASQLLEWMDNAPYSFLMEAGETELSVFETFVHRTFNGVDCVYFLRRLRSLYRSGEGLEYSLGKLIQDHGAAEGISRFKAHFFSEPHEQRSTKHLADPIKGSSAKRLNMYLRWMVRSDDQGVDFGIWKMISPSQLSLPLDVHTGNVARKLGLLKRKQNDQKAVMELDAELRKLDPLDPVKYDFALFGLGAYEGF